MADMFKRFGTDTAHVVYLACRYISEEDLVARTVRVKNSNIHTLKMTVENVKKFVKVEKFTTASDVLHIQSPSCNVEWIVFFVLDLTKLDMDVYLNKVPRHQQQLEQLRPSPALTPVQRMEYGLEQYKHDNYQRISYRIC